MLTLPQLLWRDNFSAHNVRGRAFGLMDRLAVYCREIGHFPFFRLFSLSLSPLGQKVKIIFCQRKNTTTNSRDFNACKLSVEPKKELANKKSFSSRSVILCEMRCTRWMIFSSSNALRKNISIAKVQRNPLKCVSEKKTMTVALLRLRCCIITWKSLSLFDDV